MMNEKKEILNTFNGLSQTSEKLNLEIKTISDIIRYSKVIEYDNQKVTLIYDKDTNIIITRNIENKPIYKFDFDTKKILQIFQSTKEAAIHFEITTSTILRYIAVEKIFSNKKDTNKNILLSYSNNIDNLEINQITKVIKPRRFKKLYTYYNNSIQLFFEYKGPSDAAAKLKIGQCTVHRHINNKKPLNIIYNNERISIIFSYTSF